MNLKKPLLAYMTFPLTSNPNDNKKKAVALACAIMTIFPNMFILLAHNSTQYSETIEPYRSILGDIQIIKHVDLVIIGKKPLNYSESSGSVWEFQIAKFFEKPIIFAEDLLAKKSNTEDKFSHKLEDLLGRRI